MSNRPSNSGSNPVQDSNNAKASGLSAAPKGLGLMDEKKEAALTPDITQGRHRGFMVASSIALFVSHIPLLFIFCVYMVKKREANAFLFSFFQGSPNIYFGYAIVCTVFLFLILIAPSVTPLAGRKGIQYPLYGLYLICITYLVVFSFMRQSQGIYRYDYDNILLLIGCPLYFASFGAIVTSALSVNKVPKPVAIGIACGGQFMNILLLWLFSATTLRPLWEYLLYLGWAAFLAIYYTLDLEMMVRRRGTFYRTNDWFLGFIHLQTDAFFRLPKDLFTKPANNDINQELEVAEPDVEAK